MATQSVIVHGSYGTLHVERDTGKVQKVEYHDASSRRIAPYDDIVTVDLNCNNFNKEDDETALWFHDYITKDGVTYPSPKET